MSSNNEKEFSVFGFAKGMRGGYLTFMSALQIMAIVALFTMFVQSKKDQMDREAKLYEKLIFFMAPTREKMDHAADKTISSSARLDSLTDELSHKPQLR